jgi:hypothetical protein
MALLRESLWAVHEARGEAVQPPPPPRGGTAQRMPSGSRALPRIHPGAVESLVHRRQPEAGERNEQYLNQGE